MACSLFCRIVIWSLLRCGPGIIDKDCGTLIIPDGIREVNLVVGVRLTEIISRSAGHVIVNSPSRVCGELDIPPNVTFSDPFNNCTGPSSASTSTGTTVGTTKTAPTLQTTTVGTTRGTKTAPTLPTTTVGTTRGTKTAPTLPTTTRGTKTALTLPTTTVGTTRGTKTAPTLPTTTVGTIRGTKTVPTLPTTTRGTKTALTLPTTTVGTTRGTKTTPTLPTTTRGTKTAPTLPTNTAGTPGEGTKTQGGTSTKPTWTVGGAPVVLATTPRSAAVNPADDDQQTVSILATVTGLTGAAFVISCSCLVVLRWR